MKLSISEQSKLKFLPNHYLMARTTQVLKLELKDT